MAVFEASGFTVAQKGAAAWDAVRLAPLQAMTKRSISREARNASPAAANGACSKDGFSEDFVAQ
ncbi:hypothetical protein [Burkholderia oklahomensis]|uniref:hypothetical protein n=1 Tax=Burkholderia oklahomensis TaxID=342113 RepID=UPI00057235D9|nr:hypothetical protein [Burkholderia oklahomensis]QPS41401.1 hypothetical protein I6G57_24655 [Burkholderia oklahomensis]